MRRLIVPSLASLALLVSACATGPTSEQAPTPASYAAFLTHADQLQPVPGIDGAYRWIDPKFSMAQYHKILLERIQVQPASDAEYKAVDPAQLKALVDYFQQAIVKALGDAYPVVTQPGPGVLRVKITLVDLVPTKPEMSVVALVVPFATIPDLASGAAAGGPAGSAPYLGRTGIAVQFIDSQTNRVIAEYADTQVGRKYVVDTSQGVGGAVSTGLSEYTKSFSTWAYAQQAFDGWAQQFRAYLDKVHGK